MSDYCSWGYDCVWFGDCVLHRTLSRSTHRQKDIDPPLMTLIELIDEAGILVPQNLVSDPLLNYTHDDVLF